MKKTLTTPKRTFLGKLKDFANKQERNFEKAHLKAYLKGHQFFSFGKNSFTGDKNRFVVQQHFEQPSIII